MRKYYRPPKRIGRYAAVCFVLLAAATASAIFGSELKRSVLYVLSFVLFFFSLQIFTVYILSSYEYGLDENVFCIYRVTGKRKRCIFDLDLNYATSLLRYKDAKEYIKEKGKPEKRFYCLCGVPKKNCFVLFYETDMKLALYFAPDDAYSENISSYIR